MASIGDAIVDEKCSHVLGASALAETEVFSHGARSDSIPFHAVPDLAAVAAVMADHSFFAGVPAVILRCKR